jgi:hypothetical protein
MTIPLFLGHECLCRHRQAKKRENRRSNGAAVQPMHLLSIAQLATETPHIIQDSAEQIRSRATLHPRVYR